MWDGSWDATEAPVGKLNALKVQKAKPGRHVDGQGLCLVVRPEGSRSWVLRVQVNGQRRDYGLGSTLSLTEAREKAAEWRKLAKQGKDPASEARKAMRVVPTFEKAARQYHETNKGSWKNPKHALQWINSLKAYAFPSLGEKRVDQIEASDIWAALAPIWNIKEETARRVRQRIATVLDYSKAHGWRASEAPRWAVGKLASPQTRAERNHPSMPYHEVPAFVAKLRAAAPTTGRLAVLFGIFTAVRSTEVRGAAWGEVDFDRSEWMIPAGRMKGRKKTATEHVVPLPEEAIELLRGMKGLVTGKPEELIFPGARSPKKPLSENTLNKVLAENGAADFTFHGFRSSSGHGQPSYVQLCRETWRKPRWLTSSRTRLSGLTSAPRIWSSDAH
jgi:integrase